MIASKEGPPSPLYDKIVPTLPQKKFLKVCFSVHENSTGAVYATVMKNTSQTQYTGKCKQ